MNCLPRSELERLAVCLGQGLRRELSLTPKPGLVDLADNGSHPDLNLGLMLASCEIVEGYFLAQADALGSGASLAEQRSLGLQAEQTLLTSLGTNTHKGAIFLGGLILSAAATGEDLAPENISRQVASTAQNFFAQPTPATTNGAKVRSAFQCQGIVGEACKGLPSLFTLAIPTFIAASGRGSGIRQAAFAMLAILMQHVEDSTTLHRGGMAGLQRIRQDGARLQNLIETNNHWEEFLFSINQDYCRLNLTMGGIADLLAMAFGYLEYMGWWSAMDVQIAAATEPNLPAFLNL